jgi:hypothetical protein
MKHSMFTALFGLLLFAGVAFGQDPDPAPMLEDAVEAVEEAAEATDEATEGEAPAGGDEAADAPAEGGDEAAPEGDGEEAETPKAPETDAEAVETAVSIIDAIKAGQWPLAVGLILALLVYLVNRFALKDMVSAKVVPWVSFGVGVAGATATGLLTGTPVVDSITAGVLAGVAAIGGWEMVLKTLTGGDKTPEAPEAPEAPAEETPTEDKPEA